MSFRLLTWNIRGTSKKTVGPDQVAKVIRRKRIDVAVLQEVSRSGCTLAAALDVELGIGGYALLYSLANPPLVQRRWPPPTFTYTAQPSSEERYAVIVRNGGRVAAAAIPAQPDYVANHQIANWINEPLTPHSGSKRKRTPVPKDPYRRDDLALRRPLKINLTYKTATITLYSWHAPHGGMASGGAAYRSADTRSGHDLFYRYHGGALPPRRSILAGDLNATHAANSGMGWGAHVAAPQDDITHVYGHGVTLELIDRPSIRALKTPLSDHQALVAKVRRA